MNAATECMKGAGTAGPLFMLNLPGASLNRPDLNRTRTKRMLRAMSTDAAPGDMDETRARELLEKVEALTAKHAEGWARSLGNWWSVSRNPVFAWMALRIVLDPRSPPMSLPEWLHGYLFEAATNVVALCFEGDPKDVPPLLGQALALSAPKRTIINDALEMWNAPSLVAEYEDALERAPGSARAEWAWNELRERYRLQSSQAARLRVSEAKDAVRAVIRAAGMEPTDEAISAECGTVLLLQYLLMGVFQRANLPAGSAKDVARRFVVPADRREAVKAVLAKHGDKASRGRPKRNS